MTFDNLGPVSFVHLYSKHYVLCALKEVKMRHFGLLNPIGVPAIKFINNLTGSFVALTVRPQLTLTKLVQEWQKRLNNIFINP